MSEDERSLWESVARQVRPLRATPRIAEPQSGDGAPAAASPVKAARGKVASRPGSSVPVPKLGKKPGKAALPPLVALGRRERARLSRGSSEIEARLDLHGMTQVRAHQALLGFLQRAHGDGLTFVLVVTGKGRSGAVDGERGVLRRQVPLWLSLPDFRSLVTGFEQAHAAHGGDGAIYVRIRRIRA